MTADTAGGWLLGAAVLVPIVLGMASFARGWRSGAVWGALPALDAAGWPWPARLEASWLLLGATFELDLVARTMLVLAATLWMIAAVYARGYLAEDPERHIFDGFFLLCMAGNIGLVLAADLVSFYSAFAIMTFTAYGLVVHTRTREARRAGRVYLVMAVAGEAMLVTGMILAAAETPTLMLSAVPEGIARAPSRDLIIGLLLAGFGIKAGALPLHVWLPLAHPVAPTPASAVLSGCMIKAGLLGWIRFLPAGDIALPGWGALVIVLGLSAAVGGVVLGLTQRAPKALLAYSSISQMGLINVAFGIALAVPGAWPMALPAILLYAVHHGLAKGALFLGVGVVEMTAAAGATRRWALGGVIVAALALSGAPFTSGSLAKAQLKQVAALGPGGWPLWLDALLPLTSVATAALMAVLVVRLMYHPGHAAPVPVRVRNPMVLSWGASLVAVAALTGVLARVLALGIEPHGLADAAPVWQAVWPVTAGIALVVFPLWLRNRSGRDWHMPDIAPGDVVVIAERAAASVRNVQGVLLRRPPAQPMLALAERWYTLNVQSGPDDRAVRAETTLTRWELGAAMLAILTALMAMAVAIG